MGQVKKLFYENEDRFDSKIDIEINVCYYHFEDVIPICDYIKYNGESGICSYCKEEIEVMAFKDVIKFIKEGISSFYNTANDECMNYENGEYKYASTFDPDEMLQDAGLVVKNPTLWNHIVKDFPNEIYCYIDPYGENENQTLRYQWDAFQYTVKRNFKSPLEDIHNMIPDYRRISVLDILYDIGRSIDALDLFEIVEPGTEFLRCRQHSDTETVNVAAHLCSPPNHLATSPNRMSPAGVSMFYCAFDKKTCHLETIRKDNYLKCKVTTGTFLNKNKLIILNLSDKNLPEIPSFFDSKNRQNYFKILFLHSFVNDLSKDYEDESNKEMDYAPTQVVTEYFRSTYPNFVGPKIDGIKYTSSKNPGKVACVLFLDHEESLSELEFLENKTLCENI